MMAGSSLLTSTTSLLLLVFLLVGNISALNIIRGTPSWPHPYWDIPGDYCKSHYPTKQCCPGRQDRCSVPILGTLCYCDTFCNRTETSDCCPDYFPHCLGLTKTQYQALEPAPPQEISRPKDCQYGVLDISNPMCQYKGESYSDRDTIKDNCNTCSCQASKTRPGCMEVLCSTYQCLIEPEIISELREGETTGLYSWRPSNYSHYWGKTLEEGVRGRLGALRPQVMFQHMSAIQFTYDPASLPTEFDARQEWPDLMDSIRDQQWCSSSWALSTAAVAGDRFSISKGYKIQLSSQNLVSCDLAPQAGCDGGHVDRAWGYLRYNGLWLESCMPYTGKEEECPATAPCEEQVQMQPAYRVGREDIHTQPSRREQDIMYEIKEQGPVQAVMEVYTDFFMYGSGVYQKTNLASSSVAGYHAVRILGWGQEGSLKYWTVANTWGEDWGEGGIVRIHRGDNTCQLEEFVLGAWPRERRDSTGRRRRRRRRRRQHSGGRGGRRTRHHRRPNRERGREDGRGGKHYFQVG